MRLRNGKSDDVVWSTILGNVGVWYAIGIFATLACWGITGNQELVNESWRPIINGGIAVILWILASYFVWSIYGVCHDGCYFSVDFPRSPKSILLVVAMLGIFPYLIYQRCKFAQWKRDYRQALMERQQQVNTPVSFGNTTLAPLKPINAKSGSGVIVDANAFYQSLAPIAHENQIRHQQAELDELLRITDEAHTRYMRLQKECQRLQQNLDEKRQNGCQPMQQTEVMEICRKISEKPEVARLYFVRGDGQGVYLLCLDLEIRVEERNILHDYGDYHVEFAPQGFRCVLTRSGFLPGEWSSHIDQQTGKCSLPTKKPEITKWLSLGQMVMAVDELIAGLKHHQIQAGTTRYYLDEVASLD